MTWQSILFYVLLGVYGAFVGWQTDIWIRRQSKFQPTKEKIKRNPLWIFPFLVLFFICYFIMFFLLLPLAILFEICYWPINWFADFFDKAPWDD